MKIILAILLTLSTRAFALEVDEKLTVRVVKTSESRKTIMINRGTEDGLVEGDHAKFIVTAGIVARAACVRVSPTRSVWSVYRLVNADFILNDSVMSLKITPAVKITKDETKAIVQEDTPTTVSAGDAAALGIPLADGAEDLDKSRPLTDDVGDLKAISEKDVGPTNIADKNIEVFGIGSISGLTVNTKTDTGDQSFNNSQSYHHIGLGGEIYARKEREWYSHWSLVGSFNFMRNNNQGYNGSATTNDISEFSVGTNWHPTKLPGQTMVFIPFFHASFNVGSVKSTYRPGAELSGGTEEASATGGTQGVAIGFGYKFFVPKGFGVRLLFDYYQRTERYKADEAGFKFNKTAGGPRLMIGLGHRF